MSNRQKTTLTGEATRHEAGDIVEAPIGDGGEKRRAMYMGTGDPSMKQELSEVRAAIRNICIDFDGVIHSYTSPFTELWTISDPPVEGAIEFLKRCVQHQLIRPHIYSSRSSHPLGIDAMRQWLLRHGLSPNEIDQIRFPIEKPPAHMYIDDRAWLFTGTFPTYEEMLSFNSWVKKQ